MDDKPRWTAEMQVLMFYVYILFDWMGIPRYVGKGKGNRDVKHERKTDPRNWMKNEFIERTWIVLGEVPKVRIYHATEQKAFAAEVALIKTIGRLDLDTGPLTNMAEGGEGFTTDIARKAGLTSAANLSLEQRKARGRKAGFAANVNRSLEQHMAIGHKGGSTSAANLSSDQRIERARNGAIALWTSLSPKQRTERARKGVINMSSDQRIANAYKGFVAYWANAPLDQLTSRGRKGAAALNASLSLEQRAANGRRAALSIPLEQRIANARKAGLISAAKRRSK